MNSKKNRILKMRICIVLGLSLILTSCQSLEKGNSETSSTNTMQSTEDAVKEYSAAYQNISLNANTYPLWFGQASDTFFLVYSRAANTGERNWFLGIQEWNQLKSTESVTMREVKIEIEQESWIINSFLGYEETFFLLTGSNEGESYLLIEFDINGNRVKEIDITEAYQQWMNSTRNAGKDISIAAIAQDGEGRFYFGDFQSAHGILMIQQDGSFQKDIPVMEQEMTAMVAGGDGTIYCLGKNEGEDALFQIKEDKVQLIQKLPDSKGNAMLSRDGEGNILYGYDEGVCKYLVDSAEIVKLLVWNTYGLTVREVKTLFGDGTGDLFVIQKTTNMENGLPIVFLTQEEMKKEKQEIVLACFYTSDSLDKMIGKFNVENKDYHITVEKYDWGDSERLQIELATGKGPDLIAMDMINADDYVQKGILEDLTSYLEDSTILSKDMLHSKVLELCTVDGTLTCIPPYFGITTVMGRGSELSDIDKWTIDEFLMYVDAHRGATVFEGNTYGQTREALVLTVWQSQPERWVDWEARAAKFDSEDFIELIEYATGYEAKYDEDNSNTINKIRDGRVIFYDGTIWGMESYLYCKGIYEGDMKVIGYPSWDGRSRHGFVGINAFGINASSLSKQGAWEFIEYMVVSQTGRPRENRQSDFALGFPTLKLAFEEMLEIWSTPNMVQGDDGIEREESIGSKTINRNNETIKISYYAASDEDIEFVRELIDGMSYVGRGYSVIDDILFEELSVCFNGQRLPEETAKIIQNRVQLYLDEQ